MESNLAKVRAYVKSELTCSAHDLEHTERVFRLAMLISEGMPINLKILEPAVLLHDVARARIDQMSDKTVDHAQLGSSMARAFLKTLPYSADEVDAICHCIESHRFRTTCNATSLEAQVLFDADKLDGLGATGIARSYVMIGQYGSSIYDQTKKATDNALIEKAHKHAPNIEYEVKFKTLYEKLYTEKGRKMAKERAEFMALFFKQLEDEITVNDTVE